MMSGSVPPTVTPVVAGSANIQKLKSDFSDAVAAKNPGLIGYALDSKELLFSNGTSFFKTNSSSLERSIQVISSISETYAIVAGVSDQLRIEAEGSVNLDVLLTAGAAVTAQQVADDINTQQGSNVFASSVGGKVVIKSKISSGLNVVLHPGNDASGLFSFSPLRYLLKTESGGVFTNQGAAAKLVLNLPQAQAGLKFTFITQDADLIEVKAISGETIRIAAAVSSAGGTATSGALGDCLELVCVNEAEWFATSSVGTWTLA